MIHANLCNTVKRTNIVKTLSFSCSSLQGLHCKWINCDKKLKDIYTQRLKPRWKNQALITAKIDTLNKGQNMHMFFLWTRDWSFGADVLCFEDTEVTLASGWMHHLEFGAEVLSQARDVLLHMFCDGRVGLVDPHSGGTLLDFLQDVSRQKAIFREVRIQQEKWVVLLIFRSGSTANSLEGRCCLAHSVRRWIVLPMYVKEAPATVCQVWEFQALIVRLN